MNTTTISSFEAPLAINMNTNTNTNTNMNVSSNMEDYIKKEQKYYIHPHATRKFTSALDEFNEFSSKNKKKCSKCHVEKFIFEFNGNTAGRDAFDKDGFRLKRPECNECTKHASKGKQIAMEIAKQQNISYKAPQGTPCAICKKTDVKLVFDHCHEKEIFRGYLCDPCNRSLGILGDNVEGLLNCINYLQKSEKRKIGVDEECGFVKIIDK